MVSRRRKLLDYLKRTNSKLTDPGSNASVCASKPDKATVMTRHPVALAQWMGLVAP